MVYLIWNGCNIVVNERLIQIDALMDRLAKIDTCGDPGYSGQSVCTEPHPVILTDKETLEKTDTLYFLYEGDLNCCKSAYTVTDMRILQGPAEGPSLLREGGHNSGTISHCDNMAVSETNREYDEILCKKVEKRCIRAVNVNEPEFWKQLCPEPLIYTRRNNQNIIDKKRVHILALGDVGATLLLGLKLLGGHMISSIGIYDISHNMMQRMEYEMNQMHYPDAPELMPDVDMICEDQMFDCDVFIFCASKGVPPVGTNVQDVRMVQFEENRKIISKYADIADEVGFKGIFAVVSDPVDKLCRSVLYCDLPDGKITKRRKNLRPEQIKGYGLGVMNSRGIYHARKDERFRSYLYNGRCFGPHGEGLLLVNDIASYDQALSRELTSLALNANLRTRETGFKPYLAPAVASGVISILLTLEGRWHYSSNFLGGVYMGARNRILPSGLEIEQIPMSNVLYAQVLKTYNGLF